MKGRFKFDFLSKYPHLMKVDIEIWERFIKQYPNYYTSVDYDVPVGSFRGAEIELKESYAKNREYLGKYKIDVVGYKKDVIDIIEIKPRAAAKALGQIIMYDYLYTRDYKPKLPTQAVIITDEIMPDMQEICAEHNIILIAV